MWRNYCASTPATDNPPGWFTNGKFCIIAGKPVDVAAPGDNRDNAIRLRARPTRSSGEHIAPISIAPRVGHKSGVRRSPLVRKETI